MRKDRCSRVRRSQSHSPPGCRTRSFQPLVLRRAAPRRIVPCSDRRLAPVLVPRIFVWRDPFAERGRKRRELGPSPASWKRRSAAEAPEDRRPGTERRATSPHLDLSGGSVTGGLRFSHAPIFGLKFFRSAPIPKAAVTKSSRGDRQKTWSRWDYETLLGAFATRLHGSCAGRGSVRRR
jgi:hypothetical protein